MKCPICFSKKCSPIIRGYDDRYGYSGIFKIIKCLKCNHKFLQGDFTPESLTRLYTDYYPRSTLNLDQYQPCREVKGFKSWLNGENCSAFCYVPENVRVLDIGCGFGETLGYHKARNCDVYGVEADENIRRIAEKFGYKVHVGLFDPNIYQPEFFDYVTMDQVIEHVTNPLATMCGIARILKPGGIAILSTPNTNGWGAKLFGRRWINWHAPYHLQHFSINSMRTAAEQAGLILEQAKTVTSSEWLYYQWIHLLTFPEMGEPSAFWSPYRKRDVKEKLILRVLSIMHLTKINHIFTRIFDALGIGDNYLFFLRKK